MEGGNRPVTDARWAAWSAQELCATTSSEVGAMALCPLSRQKRVSFFHPGKHGVLTVAAAAIKHMNGKKVGNSVIFVTLHQRRKARPAGTAPHTPTPSGVRRSSSPLRVTTLRRSSTGSRRASHQGEGAPDQGPGKELQEAAAKVVEETVIDVKEVRGGRVPSLHNSRQPTPTAPEARPSADTMALSMHILAESYFVKTAPASYSEQVKDAFVEALVAQSDTVVPLIQATESLMGRLAEIFEAVKADMGVKEGSAGSAAPVAPAPVPTPTPSAAPAVEPQDVPPAVSTASHVSAVIQPSTAPFAIPTTDHIRAIRAEVENIDPVDVDGVMPLLLAGLSPEEAWKCLTSRAFLAQKYNVAKKALIRSRQGEEVSATALPPAQSVEPAGGSHSQPSPVPPLPFDLATITLPVLAQASSRDILNYLLHPDAEQLLARTSLGRPDQRLANGIVEWTRGVMRKQGVERKLEMANMLMKVMAVSGSSTS